MLRHLASALTLVSLSACVAKEDAFHARIAQGCHSEYECALLHQQAIARLQECRAPNTVRIIFGPDRCEYADADVATTISYTTYYQTQAREAEATRALTEREQRRAEYEAFQQRQEAEKRAAEQQREEAAWRSLDKEGCTQRGNARACEAVAAFIQSYGTSSHLQEAAGILAQGRAQITKAEAERLEAERQQAEAEEEAKRARVRVAQPRVSLQTEEEERPASTHIRCCDGTYSPTCTTVHRGCCSHHGGVCN